MVMSCASTMSHNLLSDTFITHAWHDLVLDDYCSCEDTLMHCLIVASIIIFHGIQPIIFLRLVFKANQYIDSFVIVKVVHS
jgi:hypothetical protein